MEEPEIRNQSIISSLIFQRNEALNNIATLQGEIAVLRAKIVSLERQLLADKGEQGE